MSKHRFGCAAALVVSVAWPAYGQDGRILVQEPFTLDESLRKEIVAKAEFATGFGRRVSFLRPNRRDDTRS